MIAGHNIEFKHSGEAISWHYAYRKYCALCIGNLGLNLQGAGRLFCN